MRVTSGSGNGAGNLTADGIASALMSDPNLAATLVDALTRELVQGQQFPAQLVAAIEGVAKQYQQSAPGVLLAATVSNLSGAIQYTSTAKAMVFLHRGATAVPAYIPPHIQPSLSPGASVWVTPVNGRMSDLMVVAVRAQTGPASGSIHASQPAIPASGTPVTNTFPFPVSVVVGGGTVTQIQVDGVTLPSLTAGSVRVPHGKTIKLTYSSPPSWEWFAD